MAPEPDRMSVFARRYTEAWCSQEPARVAAHYVPDGSIAINGGAPTPIMEVAESFMAAFPDMQLPMDDLVVRDDERVEYHWTLVGTNTGPGGTGNGVRISGFEEWTIGDDGLVAESQGHFDEAEYDRQLATGWTSPDRGTQSGRSGIAMPGARPRSTALVTAVDPNLSRTSSMAASRAASWRRSNGSASWIARASSRFVSEIPTSVSPCASISGPAVTSSSLAVSRILCVCAVA